MEERKKKRNEEGRKEWGWKEDRNKVSKAKGERELERKGGR